MWKLSTDVPCSISCWRHKNFAKYTLTPSHNFPNTHAQAEISLSHDEREREDSVTDGALYPSLFLSLADDHSSTHLLNIQSLNIQC